ncbi:hypothetical protein K449DRAFT_388552, partial [Hypoxylon sp. EC38]
MKDDERRGSGTGSAYINTLFIYYLYMYIQSSVRAVGGYRIVRSPYKAFGGWL